MKRTTSVVSGSTVQFQDLDGVIQKGRVIGRAENTGGTGGSYRNSWIVLGEDGKKRVKHGFGLTVLT